MKIEKREILVYSTIPLSSRFQRSYFGEYYEFEDVNTVKKTQLGRKVDFYPYRKITFSDNKLQGKLFRDNFNVC